MVRCWGFEELVCCLEVKFLRTCNAKLEAFQRPVKILNREPGSGGTLIPALGRHRQVDLCEFKASLVYGASSRTAKDYT